MIRPPTAQETEAARSDPARPRAGPLAGYRILEFGANLAAPLATMLLGDQGADVIKIEGGLGDQMRYASARRDGQTGLSAVFLSTNRNKRSVQVDLKAPGQADLILQLVRTSDVIVQNFRPGVMERLGLAYEDVRKVNPEIIYVSVSGLGEVGPERNRRVYDTVVQGLSGLAAVQRDRDSGVPQVMQTVVVDKTTALMVFQGVTAALLVRERTGRGQKLTISMLDAALAFLWPDSMSNDTFVGDDVTPSGTASDARLVYKTKDNYILALAVSDSDWAGLTQVLDRPDLGSDPRFGTITLRMQNIRELHDALEHAFLTRTTDEWVELLRAAEAIFSRINRLDELHLDPQIVATGSIVDLQHPEAGRYRQAAHPIRFNGTPAEIARHAPRLGEHTREVLGELALSASPLRD
jgi:crotonobetainyl-CoA:carnitine CoA-transferase CaiB-like acyl-CoA transferase